MKVLIHAIGANIGGGRRHIEALVPALENLHSENIYVVLVRKGVLDEFQSSKIKLQHIPKALCSTGIRRLYFDQVTLPGIIRKGNFDICVSILNFGPIYCPAKHVVFQRNALYFDEEYIKTEPIKRRIRNRIRRLLTGLTLRNANLIVSPSHTMDEMLKKFHGSIPEERFAVLYHGFDQASLKVESKLEQPEHRNSEDNISIFYPSHFARHKGFPILFEAARILVEHRVKFTLYVTVAHDYWSSGFQWFNEQITSVQLRNYVVNLGNVAQSEIGTRYSNSDIIFFPSLCESFGFPLLEAMGYAKPIVASDIAINKEICGDGAKYFDRNSAKEAAASLEYFLNSAKRSEFSARSVKQFNQRDWSWNTYAKSLDSLLSETFLNTDMR